MLIKLHGKFGKKIYRLKDENWHMRIGITGASGNLGREISSKISQLQDNQILPISVSNFDIQNSCESLEKEISELDIIIHCATCYGRNGEDLSDLMLGNLTIPLKILENLNDDKIFINIDTVLEENISGYSFSKGSFLRSCKFLIDQGHKGKIINVKLHGFYGIKPNSRDLMYNLTKQFIENKESIDLTKCEQKRDYIFIDDVVCGINAIVENVDSFSEGFNEVEIGTSKSIPLKDIILMIKDLTNSRSKINFGAIPLRKNEPADLCADISKMKDLNWHPKTSIEEGIKKIIKEIT